MTPANPSHLIDKAFKANVIFNYGSQVLKIGLGFAWMTLLTSKAGISLYGMVVLLTSMSATLTAILTFRTNEAVVRFHREADITNDRGLAKLALAGGAILDLVVAALLLSAFHFGGPFLAATFLKDPNAAAAVSLYGWVVAVTFLRGTGMGLLASKESFRTINSLVVLDQLIKLCLLVLALMMGQAITLTLIVSIIIVTTAVTTIWISGAVFLEIFYRLRGAVIVATQLKSYLKFTASTFVSSTLKAATQNIDNLILGAITGPAAVGTYSILKQFLSPLLMIIGPFYDQIYPKFVTAVTRNETALVVGTITHTGRRIGAWSIPLCGAITILVSGYWHFAKLPFTFEFAATYFLMVASILVSQQLWWTRAFALAYDPNISIKANLIYAALILTTVTGFTALLGLSGTALGMLLSVSAIALYWVRVLRTHTRLRS